MSDYLHGKTLQRLRLRRAKRLRRQAEPINNWPGKGHGVRPPVGKETPLSMAEVVVAIRIGLLG